MIDEKRHIAIMQPYFFPYIGYCINLQFLRRNDDIRYKQRCADFVPDLSIIDPMMYCSREELHDMLDCYHFV